MNFDALDDWFSGKVACFGFRRFYLNGDPQCWTCTLQWGKFTMNLRAVVDDFGTLVPVGVDE